MTQFRVVKVALAIGFVLALGVALRAAYGLGHLHGGIDAIAATSRTSADRKSDTASDAESDGR